MWETAVILSHLSLWCLSAPQSLTHTITEIYARLSALSQREMFYDTGWGLSLPSWLLAGGIQFSPLGHEHCRYFQSGQRKARIHRWRVKMHCRSGENDQTRPAAQGLQSKGVAALSSKSWGRASVHLLPLTCPATTAQDVFCEHKDTSFTASKLAFSLCFVANINVLMSRGKKKKKEKKGRCYLLLRKSMKQASKAL